MSRRLLVLTPRIGGASETFVRRHIDELLPAEDVCVLAREHVPNPVWDPGPPVTYLGGRDAIRHGSLAWRGARVVSTRLRRMRVSNPPLGAKAAVERLVGEHETEAIFAEYLDTWATLLPQLDGLGLRIVVRAHGYDVSQRIRSVAWRDAYRRLADVAVVAAVSDYSCRVLVDAGLPAERVVKAVNAVDVDRFAMSARVAHAGPLRLLSVGRLVGKKDPTTTLRALAAFISAGGDATLTLLGDGPLRPKVDKLVEQLGIGDHVRLLGAQPHAEVLNALADADVFVQHSQTTKDGDEEGLPTGMLEAMAARRPVIGTRHAGITEVLEPDAGVLVEPNDVEAMTAAFTRLADNLDERAALAESGRARVVEGYSWNHERAALLGALGFANRV